MYVSMSPYADLQPNDPYLESILGWYGAKTYSTRNYLIDYLMYY